MTWLDSTRLDCRTTVRSINSPIVLYTNSNLNKLPVMYWIKIMFLNSLSLISCEKFGLKDEWKSIFVNLKSEKKNNISLNVQSSVHKSKHASALQSLAGYSPSEKRVPHTLLVLFFWKTWFIQNNLFEFDQLNVFRRARVSLLFYMLLMAERQ